MYDLTDNDNRVELDDIFEFSLLSLVLTESYRMMVMTRPISITSSQGVPSSKQGPSQELIHSSSLCQLSLGSVRMSCVQEYK